MSEKLSQNQETAPEKSPFDTLENYDRERKDAEYKKYLEAQEQKALESDMVLARKVLDAEKQKRFRNQAAQELVEIDLNKKLLTPDALEIESVSENPEISKRSVDYEGEQIPVYDLKGFPFVMLQTTIDYRSTNRPGEIGTETYRALMENPALWAERRDEAEKSAGFGTRNGNARGDTISTSYRNSEKNLDSVVPGELVYGFASVSPDSIISVSGGDGGTSNMAGREETRVSSLNEIKRLENPNASTIYNEVLLRRYSETGEPKRPDYIIVENGHISEASLRHAKFFNIPIVNIDTKAYQEKLERRGDELIDSISDNDTYLEISQKIAELRSMSRYKRNYDELNTLGRDRDNLRLPSPTPLQERLLKVSKLELKKRLEFIKDELKKAIAEIESATARGERAPSQPSGFNDFHVEVEDVRNAKRISPSRDYSSLPGGAGSCNFLTVNFMLKESSYPVDTKIYDGARIIDAEKARNMGVLSRAEIDAGDSSYFDALAPLAKSYIDAFRANEKAVF